MMLSNIVFFMVVMTSIVFLWGVMFFIFDTEILKGYFKKKLQTRFNVEEV